MASASTRLKPPSKSVFFGNLHPEVTDKHLLELGIQAGPVTRAQRAKDAVFGFVEFEDVESAIYCVGLYHGLLKLFGQSVNVNFSNQPVDGLDSEAQQLLARCNKLLDVTLNNRNNSAAAGAVRHGAREAKRYTPYGDARTHREQRAAHKAPTKWNDDEPASAAARTARFGPDPASQQALHGFPPQPPFQQYQQQLEQQWQQQQQPRPMRRQDRQWDEYGRAEPPVAQQQQQESAYAWQAPPTQQAYHPPPAQQLDAGAIAAMQAAAAAAAAASGLAPLPAAAVPQHQQVPLMHQGHPVSQQHLASGPGSLQQQQHAQVTVVQQQPQPQLQQPPPPVFQQQAVQRQAYQAQPAYQLPPQHQQQQYQVLQQQLYQQPQQHYQAVQQVVQPPAQPYQEPQQQQQQQQQVYQQWQPQQAVQQVVQPYQTGPSQVHQQLEVQYGQPAGPTPNGAFQTSMPSALQSHLHTQVVGQQQQQQAAMWPQ